MSDEADATRPTMADVGRAAGVSPTTVSLVLNGRDTKISSATRERVLAAVQDLDYRPNRAAQGLRLGTTSTIGFLTDEIAIEPFSGPMIAGIHDLAWERRSLLLMVNTTRNPSRLRAAVDDLLDRRVDGLLFAAMGTRQVDFPPVPPSTPTLLVNAFTADGRLPAILPDEIAGGRAAVEHVLSLGHRRIGFIAGREGAWATKMRIQGFREGLEAAGLDPSRSPIHLGNYRIDSGYEITWKVMREKKPPTALLLGNDQMAAGAYIALARLGLRIPDDVSVVGYDDEPLAADLSPALTTVRIPFYEMGRIAARHTLDRTVGDLPSRTYEPCTIIHRSSTNPPPGE
jgi:LacI family transcriptional regulator